MMNKVREQNTLTGIQWLDNDPLFLAMGASLPKDAPQGDALDDNDLFDEIDTEMMKRGTLNHTSVRWDWVGEQCAELLKSEAKDFRLLLYILQSLPNMKNYQEPLTLGAVLTSRFVAIWGEIAYPAPKKRLTPARKIIDALEQLAVHALQTGIAPELVPVTVQSLQQSADFFAVMDPDFGLRLHALPNKIEASIIENDSSGLPSLEKTLKEPVKARPILEMKEGHTTSAPAMEFHPENLVLDSKNERALKQSLTVVSDFLLGIDISNPLSYRLRRFATWFGIEDAPAIKKDNKTVILPVSANALDEYRIAAERGRMDYEIAQKLERSCHIQPFWIEGQYLAYRLALICDRKSAAEAVFEETKQFVAKTDWLLKLCFMDGTPFIPDHVKSWLDSYTKTGAASGQPQENEMIGGEMQAIIRSAREKAGQGQTDAAIKILEQSRPATDSLRSRTLWEMLMLECLSEWGMKNLVSSQAARLEKDIQDMPVKEFEPDLISRIKHLSA